MKKDISLPAVEDVAIAIILEDVEGENVWNTYLVNMKDVALENVLIVSKGYGEIKGESRQTTTLRFFFEEIPAGEFVKIEPIMDYTFGLSNEYWLSFYIGSTIYDKKYIFLPETIHEKNFTKIPIINVEGVMIR